MKKLLCLILLTLTIFLSGCNQTLPFANCTRDSENIGGSISVEYNKSTGEIFIGGENQQIQYYEANIARGWQEGGNRVGLKFTAPSKVKEYETGSVSLQGKTITSGDFYQEVNGQKTGIAFVYPLIKNVDEEIEIKITWQDGSEEQVYKLIIKEGTRLMEAKKDE